MTPRDEDLAGRCEFCAQDSIVEVSADGCSMGLCRAHLQEAADAPSLSEGARQELLRVLAAKP